MINWILDQSAWAAMTKYHTLGSLNNRNLFSHISGDQRSKNKVHSGFLVRSLFLAYKRPPSHCVLTWSHLCTHTKREILSSSYKDTTLLDQGPTFTTPFNLHYLPKSPIFKYRHVGVWTLTYELEEQGRGTRFSPTEIPKEYSDNTSLHWQTHTFLPQRRQGTRMKCII